MDTTVSSLLRQVMTEMVVVLVVGVAFVVEALQLVEAVAPVGCSDGKAASKNPGQDSPLDHGPCYHCTIPPDRPWRSHLQVRLC